MGETVPDVCEMRIARKSAFLDVTLTNPSDVQTINENLEGTTRRGSEMANNARTLGRSKQIRRTAPSTEQP